MLSLIAAISKNGVIGKENALPWYLPEDLKRFKQITTGKTVLMGRKTFESILKRLGKPLPNRKNVVVTRDSDYSVAKPQTTGGLATSVTMYHSIDDALKAHKGEDIIVIGGGEIYAQTIDRADKLYTTEVRQEIEGDTFFPRIDPAIWKESAREDHEGFSFVEYVRIYNPPSLSLT
ncbi:MAG: Dihydrofolate reductase [Parcubacteria group bacterium GW2011_GWA2_47_26]|nr:MAG: Dihydrofolate reductase [Parcubacteria group bacterium GW2011_GWA2_47_26]